MSAAAEPPEPDPAVGSLAEEAVRLVAALRDATHEHPAPGAPAPAAAPPDAPTSAECAWCPVCRALRLLRVSDPAVREHLAAAGASLLAAAAAALAPPADVMGAPGPAEGEDP